MSNPQPMTVVDIAILKHKIAKTFTPSAPIDRYALFAGRNEQVNRLMNAVSQKGQHAILFGERGVGKTSLATVLKELLLIVQEKDQTFQAAVGSTNCEATSTFQSIWKAILNDMPITFRETGMGLIPTVNEQKGTFADLCPELNSAEDIRHLFESVKGKQVIVIIDEIDQIRTPGTAKSIADTIKTLSDHAVNATIILVGVADSVDNLIAEHASIERALVQIKMERMSPEELHEIIDKGLKEIEMHADYEVKRKISALSQGLPHYTHLLVLHAAQAAAESSRLNLMLADVDKAIEKAVNGAQQSTVSAYHQATTSRRGNLYAQVLTACALAKKDDLSYFSSSEVRDPMSKIMGKPYEIPAFSQHLNDFCDEDRGPILQKTGYARRYRFRFCNPLMEPYVVMKALSSQHIKTLD